MKISAAKNIHKCKKRGKVSFNLTRRKVSKLVIKVVKKYFGSSLQREFFSSVILGGSLLEQQIFTSSRNFIVSRAVIEVIFFSVAEEELWRCFGKR